jgi:hypothetical protein
MFVAELASHGVLVLAWVGPQGASVFVFNVLHGALLRQDKGQQRS